tara:strand:- start:909 stop:1580 length:672 start_codon:yes stop_codon:yes gene_type:complete
MPYYPLSQVLTNLFTNGEEYVLKSTFAPYTGYYHEISDGSRYSEKIPTKSSILLIKLNPVTGNPESTYPTPFSQGKVIAVLNKQFPTTDSEIIINPKTKTPYTSPDPLYISNDSPRTIPTPHVSYPTKEDRLKEGYTRYFCKKNNELKYFEINQPTYQALANLNPGIASDLYSGAPLPWKIKGNKEVVFTTNRNQSEKIEKQFRWPGFSQYFKGKFTQFYLED